MEKLNNVMASAFAEAFAEKPGTRKLNRAQVEAIKSAYKMRRIVPELLDKTINVLKGRGCDPKQIKDVLRKAEHLEKLRTRSARDSLFSISAKIKGFYGKGVRGMHLQPYKLRVCDIVMVHRELADLAVKLFPYWEEMIKEAATC